MAASGTVVLMYHALETPGGPRHGRGINDAAYTLSASDFSRQMERISRAGTCTFPPGHGSGKTDIPSPSPEGVKVIITFDDGSVSDHSAALPVLLGLGLKAAFFITAGRIGGDGAMSEEMIRDLFKAGMTVGSHGLTHRYLTDIPRDELIRELSDSRKKIEDIIHSPVDSLSAPGGRIDRHVTEAAVENGYMWIYSSRASVNREIAPGAPIARFAVRGGATDEWFSAVTSGSPPSGEIMRYGILLAAKRLLGNRGYEKARKALQGRKK